MFQNFKITLIFSLFISIISCSSSQQTIEDNTPVSNSANPVDTLETSGNRILPYPVDVLPTYDLAIRNGTRTTQGKPGPNYWQQYTHYDLHAEVIPEDTLLEGSGTITYYNNSPDSLNAIYMELSQNLHKGGVVRNETSEITGGIEIHHVVLDDDTLTYGARQGGRYFVDGTRLVLANGNNISPGDSASIDIKWSFKIPQAGASGRMGYSRGNLYHLAYWYPFVSVYDDVNGWFTDSFLGQTEFYLGYGDYDIQLTMPDNWLIVATGTLANRQDILMPEILQRYNNAKESDTTVTVVSENDFGSITQPGKSGTHTWNFSASNVRDFVFSAATESIWDVRRTPVGDLNGDGNTDYSRIEALYRTSAPLWSEVADYSAHTISFLSEYTGVNYPWPHMTAIEGGDIIGGGMEFPMMTLMGTYNSRGANALYNVTAHELAHMWVPMIVGTNERRYSWMDEGTTTFNEGQARADRFPDSNPVISDQNGYLRIVGSGLEGEIMRWSNYHYFGFAYGVASYSKPGSILAALRGVLGTEVFNKAFQTYMQRWKYKHPYPWDMFSTFEDVSGRDLEWFWRSWYYETWSLDQSIDEVTQTDPGEVTITVSDNGEVPMPVLLTFIHEDGSETAKRIAVDRWLEGATLLTTRYQFEKPVKEVVIDKNRHFPDVNRSDNEYTL